MSLNYRINVDGEMSDISLTTDAVDNYEVFATIGEAKIELLADLRRRRSGLDHAIRTIKQTTARGLREAER